MIAFLANGFDTSAPPHLHNGNGHTPHWVARYLELRKQGVPEREATYQAMAEANAKGNIR